ncbi:MAG: hypothetical protein WC444_04745 [Candidatus Paceibacterota bacterium]
MYHYDIRRRSNAALALLKELAVTHGPLFITHDLKKTEMDDLTNYPFVVCADEHKIEVIKDRLGGLCGACICVDYET